MASSPTPVSGVTQTPVAVPKSRVCHTRTTQSNYERRQPRRLYTRTLARRLR